MPNTLTNKERMKIPRQQMPEQDGVKRSHNFSEVNLGLTEELAILEAQRCIQCPKPTCVEGCPVEVKIGEFISLVSERKFLEAAAKIKEDNMLLVKRTNRSRLEDLKDLLQIMKD